MAKLTIMILLTLLAGCSAGSPLTAMRGPCGDDEYVPVCEVHIKSTRCDCVYRQAIFGEYEDNAIYGEDAQ